MNLVEFWVAHKLNFNMITSEWIPGKPNEEERVHSKRRVSSIIEAFGVPLQSHRTAKTNSSGRRESGEGNQLLITLYANWLWNKKWKNNFNRN